MKLRNVLIVVKNIEKSKKNFIMIYLVWIRYWTMMET